MTSRIYSHGQQGPADYSVFWQDDTVTNDAACQGGQLVDVRSSGAGLMPTVAAPTTQTLYLTEAGNTAAVSVNDINQGQLADCFLLSSFGEEALFHQAAITKMIHDNGNGTEIVTLYVDKNGRLPGFSSTSFKSTAVTINNSFSGSSVNNGAKQDVVGKLKEIWPQVVEKAVATLGGGINSIADGGYPVIAMEELTGHVATFTSPASLTLAALTAEIAAGDLIVMETSARGGLPYGLVSDHAYMFEKLNGSGGSATVQLRNPWGFNQPAAIPFTKLAQSGIVNIDIGHTS
jgi:Calpain family cysteine protease